MIIENQEITENFSLLIFKGVNTFDAIWILLNHSVCSSKVDTAVKLLLKVSYEKVEWGFGSSFSHF